MVLQRRAFTLATLLAGFAAAVPSTAAAQNGRAPNPDAKRILVPVFRSQDKTLGVQAADAVRGRVTSDLGNRGEVIVLSKEDIEKTLEASGYATNDALSPSDARELGRQLRANEYLEGTVTKTATGVRIEPRLVLVRDNSLVQPLPAAEGGKVGDAAKSISGALRDARKQLKSEEECYTNSRLRKYPEAMAAARKGIQAYSQATIARGCLLQVYKDMPMDSAAKRDSVFKLANEMLQVDPRNTQALTSVAEIYDQRGDNQKAAQAYAQLVSNDPTNTRVVDLAVRRIAASGQSQIALPIIRQAVQQNQGDPQLLRLQWLVELAAKDFKGATNTGNALVQLDTAFADSSFFVRMAGAYVADSQPQKAAEILARGVQKFPANQDLLVSYAQALKSAGQTQQAVQTIQRALQSNPKLAGGYALLASLQGELGQTAEAVTSLKTGLANGDTPANVAPFALQLGNTLYKKAAASKTQEDYQAALNVLTFADSIAPATAATKQQGQFLLGVTALSLGAQQLQASQQGKNCELAQAAEKNFSTAQINLPAGGKFNPTATQQSLAALQQYSAYPARLQKAYCK